MNMQAFYLLKEIGLRSGVPVACPCLDWQQRAVAVCSGEPARRRTQRCQVGITERRSAAS